MAKWILHDTGPLKFLCLLTVLLDYTEISGSLSAAPVVVLLVVACQANKAHILISLIRTRVDAVWFQDSKSALHI